MLKDPAIEVKKKEIKENLFVSIIFNVVIPMFILTKLSAKLGPMHALIIALLFPFCYALYDFYKRKKTNLISILGFAGILIKGVFAFYKLDGVWFALQEAAIPIFLGIFTIVSVWLNKPLVNYFIYNENVFNIELINKKLNDNKNNETNFKKAIWQITLLFGLLFFLGGVVNYFLARYIITSPAGTEAFNKELGHMTFLSYFVIVIPKIIISFAGLWWFIKQLKNMTGLELEQIMKESK